MFVVQFRQQIEGAHVYFLDLGRPDLIGEPKKKSRVAGGVGLREMWEVNRPTTAGRSGGWCGC